MDEFLEWFRNCLSYLGQLMFDAICQAWDMFLNVLAWIIVLFIVILVSPIWLLPFIYWLLFVKNKKDRGGVE